MGHNSPSNERVPTIIAIVVAIILVLIAVSCNTAHAADGSLWDKWGVAPYASSQEEACKKAPAAIDGLTSLSPEARQYFTTTLGTTCKGGTEAWLVPHQQLEQMWSGPDSHHKQSHVMDKKTVAELPVLKSPDGRPYRKGAVAETAKALSWTFTGAGKTEILYLPFACFNWSSAFGSPVVPAQPPSPLKPINGSCPEVYTLKVNVWARSAFALSGVERTHAREEIEEHFVYKLHDSKHVSRNHDRQFREAYAAGKIARSSVAYAFRVSFIMTPEARGGEPTITEEQFHSDITVTGMYELRLTRSQLEKWDAIRLIPIEDGGILSPPRYHLTGLHELRFFNHLPGTTLGEWDGNPVPDCIMNEHWIEK